MKPERRKPSGREKNEASVKLLERLREQLYSFNPSVRRQAAFNLSWMQEDGLEILKEALFGNFPTRNKNAAAYGLRNMRGRMKKMALEVFEQGLHQTNSTVSEVCRHALSLMGMRTGGESLSRRTATGNLEIREIRQRGRPRARANEGRTRGRRLAKNDDAF